MCGIAGYAGRNPPGAPLLHAMCDALVHRGPDEDGYLLGEQVALGMRRLAIIDVAHGGQPVFNEDSSLAVVFNGEIYNFQELRGELQERGHSFSTETDTECIVHLYEEYGERCVEHLRGMFAFALWDQPQRRLFLARDRVGKKPLYYRLTAQGLWFGSELKALLQDDGCPREVDRQALHRYFTFGYVPAPQAILAGVRKLPPATTLTYDCATATASLQRYWQLSYAVKVSLGEAEASQALRGLIEEATRIRLVSQRPLGAFLSGGVDSSLVVAAMAQEMSAPVKTFSIGFQDARYDERSYARLVAQRFSTEHQELVVRPDIEDLLPRLTWHFDEPFADSSAVPSFYLAEMARRQVVVALTGDGGDESFGGYERYVAQRLAARIHVPQCLSTVALRAVGRLPAGAHGSALRRARRFLSFALTPAATRYAQVVSGFNEAELQALYHPEMRQASAALTPYSPLSEAFAHSDAPDPAEAAMDVDVQTYLPGDLLVKMDIATMANSLEARSPLLDHKVMEFAASLPANYKVRGRSGKWLLKEVARGWLPDAVLDRPKMGFAVPVAEWLRHELHDLTWDALTDATARGRPYFQPAGVSALLEEHDRGSDHSRKIWTLLCFELWHRMFIDQRAIKAPAATGPRL